MKRTADDKKGSTVRCAIYTRKSTEEGLEQEFNSLDAQRESAEAYIASRKTAFAAADVPPLLLAALSSVLAVITGNVAHDSMRFTDALHEYVEWHQYAGTALLVLLVGLTIIRLCSWRRLDGAWLAVYLSGLLLGVGLVSVVGFRGGSLVFGPNHLWP